MHRRLPADPVAEYAETAVDDAPPDTRALLDSGQLDRRIGRPVDIETDLPEIQAVRIKRVFVTPAIPPTAGPGKFQTACPRDAILIGNRALSAGKRPQEFALSPYRLAAPG
jgi:hypothetical protein